MYIVGIKKLGDIVKFWQCPESVGCSGWTHDPKTAWHFDTFQGASKIAKSYENACIFSFTEKKVACGLR